MESLVMAARNRLTPHAIRREDAPTRRRRQTRCRGAKAHACTSATNSSARTTDLKTLRDLETLCQAHLVQAMPRLVQVLKIPGAPPAQRKFLVFRVSNASRSRR